MEINLIDPVKSQIKYEIFRFPDGEIQIKLDNIDHKESYDVKCRVRSAEELFILMQVADILNRHGVLFDIEIYYLMSMRMDRVMEFNRPFSLNIVLKVLDGLGARVVYILEPHSSRAVYSDSTFFKDGIDILLKNIDLSEYLPVLPDRGAQERYRWICGGLNCSKVRDISSGKLVGFSLVNPEILETIKKPLLVIDDLCDGGGTFAGIADEIRKYTDRELNIFVTHMVNEKGIKTLSDNYDKVYFTNSYKDWENLPDNVTMFNVCQH